MTMDSNSGALPLPVFTTESAFSYYRSLEDRLPLVVNTEKPRLARKATDLIAIADQFDVFVFDAFGVLNVGDSAIPGARECVSGLRAMGKEIFVLTNGASLPLDKMVEKFTKYNFDFTENEIVSSRYCAEKALVRLTSIKPEIKLWGAITAGLSTVDDLPVLAIELDNDQSDYDRVDAILFLSASNWSAGKQELLLESMRMRKRLLIVANPDVVAPKETGFSLEPGYFSHSLIDQMQVPFRFYGKPFPSVFQEVANRCSKIIDPRRIAMVGDTLHTDILGANSYGWSSVLVTDHGLFRGEDVGSYINKCQMVPDWIMPSIGVAGG